MDYELLCLEMETVERPLSNGNDGTSFKSFKITINHFGSSQTVRMDFKNLQLGIVSQSTRVII